MKATGTAVLLLGALSLAAVAAACSDEDPTGTSQPLEGTYILNTAAGRPLPAVAWMTRDSGLVGGQSDLCYGTEADTYRDVITSSTAQFTSSGYVSLTLSGMSECLSGSDVISSESISGSSQLLWSRDGRSLTFAFPPDAGGDDYPFPMPTGVVDGDEVTITLAFGFSAFYATVYDMVPLHFRKAGS